MHGKRWVPGSWQEALSVLFMAKVCAVARSSVITHVYSDSESECWVWKRRFPPEARLLGGCAYVGKRASISNQKLALQPRHGRTFVLTKVLLIRLAVEVDLVEQPHCRRARDEEGDDCDDALSVKGHCFSRVFTRCSLCGG